MSHASRKRLQIYLLVPSHVYYRALELAVKQPTKSKIKIGTGVWTRFEETLTCDDKSIRVPLVSSLRLSP